MAASAHTVTIQIGRTAGFTGAHFWSMLEEELQYEPSDPNLAELSTSTHFEEVGGEGRSHYTARTVAFDNLGSAGDLPYTGQLSDVDKQAYWDGNVDVIENSGAHVGVGPQWGPLFHTQVEDGAVWTPTLSAEDDTHAAGFEFFKAKAEDWSDMIRKKVERSDFLRYFTWLVDGGGFYGGFSHGCLDYVEDEIGKMNHVLVSLAEKEHFKSMQRAATEMGRTFFLCHCLDRVSAVVPLSAEQVLSSNKQAPLPFKHLREVEDTTAVIAMAMEGIIAPWRRRGKGVHSLSTFVSSMYEHRVFDVLLSLPQWTAGKAKMNLELTPLRGDLKKVQVIQQCFRGIPATVWGGEDTVLSPHDPIRGKAYRAAIGEQLQGYFGDAVEYLVKEEKNGLSLAGDVSVLNRPAAFPQVYPNIFEDNALSFDGRLSGREMREGPVRRSCLRTASCLSSHCHSFLDGCVSTLEESSRLSPLASGIEEEKDQVLDMIENVKIRSSYLKSALRE
mmetsp:Transcript_23709/g.59768  ORF Transcript_23709/g.59768 Transcript_23709/m.59768 type:complete len:501 (-) Transcript_23709:710-2212(-)